MTDSVSARSTSLTGTVIVPAYNEATVISASLPTIARTLVEHRGLSARTWEILVVDDGSSDETAALAEECRGPLLRLGVALRIVRHRVNRGLGKALQTAFAASTGDVVVVIDCDLSYSPEHIPLLVGALVEADAQVALASPYMEGGTTIGVPPQLERRSRMANAFLSSMGNVDIATMTGMVRAYDGQFIRALSLKSLDAEINIEVIYKTKVLRGRIVEVPSTLNWSGLEERAVRTSLRSKRNRWKVYQTLVNGILFRPYVLFLAAGLVALGLSAIFGIAAMAVPDVQPYLMIFCACSGATGVLLCFGFLLSLQTKRYFDELYFQGYRLEVQQRRSALQQAAAGPEPKLVEVNELSGPSGVVKNSAVERDSPAATVRVARQR